MKKSKRVKAERARGILDGHDRVGRRLKTPISSLPQLRQTSYIDEIIPEIIHIGMIFDAYGYHDGMRLCESLFEAVGPHAPDSHIPLVSHLAASVGEADKVLDALKENGTLQKIQIVNTPLSLVSGWPLEFLGTIEMERELALSRLKVCVGRLLDKSKTPACAALATILYWQRASGKLHYVNGVTPPDLNVIVERPDSDDAKLAAAHVRASTMAFWAMNQYEGGVSGEWAIRFWRESFRLAPCTVRESDDDDD